MKVNEHLRISKVVHLLNFGGEMGMTKKQAIVIPPMSGGVFVFRRHSHCGAPFSTLAPIGVTIIRGYQGYEKRTVAASSRANETVNYAGIYAVDGL